MTFWRVLPEHAAPGAFFCQTDPSLKQNPAKSNSLLIWGFPTKMLLAGTPGTRRSWGVFLSDRFELETKPSQIEFSVNLGFSDKNAVGG
jgi:hypothetical protein